MMQHLQDILGKVYRPAADGTRQAFASSRSDAEKLPLLPSTAEKAQPEKQVNTLVALLRVVRLSLALPSRFAWDAPSLSRHPNDYGMEPASPGRLLFRASTFASAPDVSEHPPRIRYPLRAGGQHLVRTGGNGYITEARRLDGAAPTIRRHCARRLACRFLHPSIGVDGVHEP